MTNKKLTLTFLSIILAVIISCGTGIGNGIWDPTNSVHIGEDINPLRSSDINQPIDEYEDTNTTVDCGSFTEQSTLLDVDQGRSCIYDSFTSGEGCIDAKYLLNKTNIDGSRFISFVWVQSDDFGGNCKLRVHTVSNIPPNEIGNKIRTCTELQYSEIPEVACGILE